MNNKDKKRLPKTFTESEVGTLIEHFDSKVDLVLEGHAVLNKRIDNLDAKMDAKFQEVDGKFQIVFQKFRDVDKRFDGVDQRLDKVEQRLDKMDETLESVQDELRLVRNELKEKVGRDEFLVLEKRVAALEKTSRRQ